MVGNYENFELEEISEAKISPDSRFLATLGPNLEGSKMKLVLWETSSLKLLEEDFLEMENEYGAFYDG